MVDFSSPPRAPNAWFEPEQEPPAPTGRNSGRRGSRAIDRLAVPAFVTAALGLAITVVAQLPDVKPDSSIYFANTRLAPEAERFLRAVIGPSPRLSGVRRAMAEARVFCRSVVGRRADSLMICLGQSVRFGRVYTRMAFRFVATGDTVRAVVVCPAMVLRDRTAPPESLRRVATPSLDHPACWRDPDVPSHAEWAYAALPEGERFTTVPVPDAPRMRVESDPSRDTVRVIW